VVLTKLDIYVYLYMKITNVLEKTSLLSSSIKMMECFALMNRNINCVEGLVWSVRCIICHFIVLNNVIDLTICRRH
jgi:hypothetical protein